MADSGTVGQWREFAEPCAVGEPVLAAVGHLEREPGLTDPADAGQRDEWTGAHGVAQRSHLAVTADETLRATRHVRLNGLSSGDGG